MIKTDRLAARLADGAKSDVEDPFVITPTPNLDGLIEEGAAGIDLRLGTWFTHLKQTQTPYLPLDPQTPEKMAGSMQLATTNYVPLGRSYMLHPQSFVLAVTLEWICLPCDLAAYVVGKSSWGRCGLVIATATGVHPGFKGCLTLELTNVGQIPIEIKPGVRICQLFIHSMESDSKAVSSSTFDGLRQPVFRPIKLDEYARKLSAAYTGRRDPGKS